MDKQIINTSKAPSPIGPYSQAVKASGMLYISGQIAFNPATSELITATIREEAEQVMNNLKAILESAELDFTNVIKTTIFLSDMNLFADVNEVYGKFFDTNYPARETVAVKTLPKNVNVEISMIASE